MAGGGATSVATSGDADAAGAGGRHGVEKKSERVSSWGENLAGKFSLVGCRDRVMRPLGWRKTTPGGIARR